MSKIIIIGRNYTSRLGMIRALGKAGHEIIVIKTNGVSKDIDAYSKYVSSYQYAQEPNQNLLVDKILSFSDEKQKTIIVPVDDYAASTVDRYADILAPYFIFPNVGMKTGAVSHLMDKDFQKDLARKAGLPVAKGWTIEIKNGKYEIPADIEYPCFPKPQISFLGNKLCMKKCSNEVELKDVLEQVASVRDCPLLVEQYIEIEKEYGVLGCCYNGDNVTPGIVDKILIGDGRHKGVTKVGVVTPLEDKTDLYNSIKKFLKLTGFTGLCDIDLYECNGIVYFNELNLRFGAFGYSILCSGANLPSLFVTAITTNTFRPENVKVRKKTVCLSEKVNFEDYEAGFYGYKEYKRICNMADCFFLQDGEDSQPYKVYRHEIHKIMLKMYIKKLLRLIIKK